MSLKLKDLTTYSIGPCGSKSYIKDLTPYSIATHGSKSYKRIGLRQKKRWSSNPRNLSIKEYLHSIFCQIMSLFGLDIIFTILFNILNLCQCNIKYMISVCQININYIIFMETIITTIFGVYFAIMKFGFVWRVLQCIHFYRKHSILILAICTVVNGCIIYQIQITYFTFELKSI